MEKDLNEVKDILDLDRTNELFDSSIKSADSKSGKAYTKDSVKEAKVALGFGNLHINTAKIKTQILRMIGFKNNISQIKSNIERQIRNSKKYKK